MNLANKEVLEKLKNYYLTQDPDTVCYCLAAMALDIHRWVNASSCKPNEMKSLEERWYKMSLELVKFVKDGPQGDLRVNVSNSEEEE